MDGFWLPQRVQASVLSPETEYVTLSCANGRPCEAGDPGAVTARWPRLQAEQWARLLAALEENRQQVPKGQSFCDRLQRALQAVAQRFADPSDPLRAQALAALPGYTGYSEPMIRFSLSSLDLMALDQLPAAFSLSPTSRVTTTWQAMPGLPGRLRFYAANPWLSALRRLPGLGNYPLFASSTALDLVLGYGAGNVPGTALLIAFLSQAVALTGGPPPAVVVKNSRHEPIFAPLVLQGIEAVDPDLVSSMAILIWDYEETAVQESLLSQADLAIVAASDETIAQIEAQINRVAEKKARPLRFHAHGHKVSFSAIGREVLAHGRQEPASGQPLLDIVTLLAALDSVFWDQNGCVSSRIHFVETGSAGHHTALEYASRLQAQLRLLADYLPRGAWPRRQLHERFDRYKLLETTAQVQVLSTYDDEFLVAIDERPLPAAAFRSLVNDCQGRVIFVRPVPDLMELPNHYLRLLPARNLQSLSVAIGQPGKSLTERFLRFAEACGARGVTAIRTVGRGAFPQLAYSWDGFIPLDLLRPRLAGHFTTIEFDAPYEQTLETYQTLLQRGTALGLVGNPS